MRDIDLKQILVIGVTGAAMLMAGAIGFGLTVEAHLILPPTLNLQVGSVSLVSFLLPHECPAAQLCPVANQSHESYSYALWLFIYSKPSMAPHVFEIMRLPLAVP